MTYEVVELAARDTHTLRRAVLRKGMESTDVAFPEDEIDGAFHLAVADGDDVVAVASFSPSPTEYRPGVAAWQLRGMAVAEAFQRQGLGELLVRAAIDRVQATGSRVLWCNARDSAQAFYARLGFVVHGDGFITATTQLPHHVMVRDL